MRPDGSSSSDASCVGRLAGVKAAAPLSPPPPPPPPVAAAAVAGASEEVGCPAPEPYSCLGLADHVSTERLVVGLVQSFEGCCVLVIAAEGNPGVGGIAKFKYGASGATRRKEAPLRLPAKSIRCRTSAYEIVSPAQAMLHIECTTCDLNGTTATQFISWNWSTVVSPILSESLVSNRTFDLKLPASQAQ